MNYEEHQAKWSACRRCTLAKHRKQVCLVRGRFGPDGRWMLNLPADILFIGEAPGISEDSIGDPFVGPAGSLLDHIAKDAGAFERECAWTNVIGCIPLIEGEKAAKPPTFAMAACQPRLREIIALCRPKLVVLVGDVSQKWVGKHRADLGLADVPAVDLTHPAAILRGPMAGKTLTIQRCVLVLRKAVEALAAPAEIVPRVGLFD